jgi:hypothetical protein
MKPACAARSLTTAAGVVAAAPAVGCAAAPLVDCGAPVVGFGAEDVVGGLAGLGA